MKKTTLSTIGIALIAIIACTKPNSVIYSNGPSIKKSETLSKDTMWHLKHRIPNCDSALVFMKQVIIPVRSEPKLEKLLPIEREILVRISGEGLDLQNNKKYKFYINPDCFIGQPAERAFQILCQPDSVASFIELDKAFQAKNLSWILTAGGFGTCLVVRLEKGFIKNAAFCKVYTSH